MGECKFCGAKINTPNYLSKTEYSCNNCGKFCMDRCLEVYSTTTSWHTEPCVSCEKNPYRKNHMFLNGEWVKNV